MDLNSRLHLGTSVFDRGQRGSQSKWGKNAHSDPHSSSRCKHQGPHPCWLPPKCREGCPLVTFVSHGCPGLFPSLPQTPSSLCFSFPSSSWLFFLSIRHQLPFLYCTFVEVVWAFSASDLPGSTSLSPTSSHRGHLQMQLQVGVERQEISTC